MEDSQYKTIEEQALQIVGTLNRLKDEIEGYRDARIETQKSLDSLDTLLGAVSDAAKQLSDAAKELRGSDYTKLHKKISKEAEVVTSACETLQQNLDGVTEQVGQLPATLTTVLEAHDARQVEKDSELLTRVANLEEMVARIDRNTQKGFGKERG